jgi:hypothetical protein
MNGIHSSGFTAAQPGKLGILLKSDLMEVLIVDFSVAMLLRALHLGFDVLIERPTEKHVQKLQSPADSEHRLIAGQELFGELDLISISNSVACPFGLQGLFSVSGGRYVGSTLENKSVQIPGEIAKRDG